MTTHGNRGLNLLLIIALVISVQNVLGVVGTAYWLTEGWPPLIWWYASFIVVLPWFLYSGLVELRGLLVFSLVIGGPLLTAGAVLAGLAEGTPGIVIPFMLGILPPSLVIP